MARGLLDAYIPAPADPNAPQSAPSLGLLGTLENFSAGVGQGQVDRLNALASMFRNPREAANALGKFYGNALLFGSRMMPMQQRQEIVQNALAGARADVGNALSSPMGFGQMIGQTTTLRGLLGGNVSMPNPVMREAVAYHGSPHDFDEFDASKIGTGKGEQAYGHGLYFAENPDVAKDYKPASGRLYKADIPDHQIEKMLDWNKSLSEQPPELRAPFEARGIKDGPKGIYWYNDLSNSFIDTPEGGDGSLAALQKAASKYLHAAGVPGIKFRDAGKGSRNFVVFDDKLVKILEKN